MIRYAIAAVVLLLGCSSWDDARAANCSNYPYTLQNGQTADANQVMANFNNVLNCTNTNLLGASNNLSDVGSASASRNNLGLGAAAVEGLGSNVVDDGSGNLYSKTNLHVQLFTTTGTFTVPVGTTSSTVYKITAVGGGGGGGGASGSNAAGGGGASGDFGFVWLSGLTAGQTVAVTVGTGGTAGSSSGTGTGGTGVSTTIASPNSTTILTCYGGSGGFGSTSSTASSAPGVSGACGVTFSGSLLTLVAQNQYGGQDGAPGLGAAFSGAGGGNPVGHGGTGLVSFGGLGNSGTNGGGGGGATSSGTAHAGAVGATGEVVFEWVQ